MANNLPRWFEDPADLDDIHELAEMPFVEDDAYSEEFIETLEDGDSDIFIE